MIKPSTPRLAHWLAATALTAGAPLAMALGVSDAVGDYVPGYAAAGGSVLGDLDVVSSFVTYNAGSNLFTVSGTMAAAIGSTSTGFFVWGFNTGTGPIAPFAGVGAPNVKFNSVVILRPNGASFAGAPANAITPVISGNTISTTFSGNFLASTGFGKANYTWNLWPRDGALAAGNGQISDFAPDNAMAGVQAVPEPASVAMLLLGLGVIAGAARRRRG